FVVVFALCLAAGAARADAPVTTTSGAEASPPQPQADAPPLAAAVVHQHQSAGQVAMGPCGPERVRADGALDRAPHGQVEAGVGTQGYRHLAAAACQPVGDNGAVSVSAGASQARWDRR